MFQKIAKSWSSTENTSTWSLWRSPLNERTRFVLLYVHRLYRPQGYFSNRKKTVTWSLYCIFMVAFNRPVTVEVLPSCCCMFVVEKLTTSNSCGNHSTKALSFFICWPGLALRHRIMKASPPEANQFIENCFRMVRIVSKICFLEIKEGCSILSCPIPPHC